MALPKIFTGGERLFADDLNDNFTYLDSELEQVGPEFDIIGTDTVSMVFDKDRILSRVATGDVAFEGSGYTPGRSVTVRVFAGAEQRNLTFPPDWKFVSFKPSVIAQDKVGILAVTAFGVGEADAIAVWAVED